jgi:hypothetical protein
MGHLEESRSALWLTCAVFFACSTWPGGSIAVNVVPSSMHMHALPASWSGNGQALDCVWLMNVYTGSTELQRETEEKACQPETKLGAIAQTRHTARLHNAKRSRTRHPKPTHGAQDRPKQPQPWAGRDRASESGQRHASRRTRPTDTGTRRPGKGQRVAPRAPGHRLRLFPPVLRPVCGFGVSGSASLCVTKPCCVACLCDCT